eukprot:TRINITY_DN47027_c0_g1_i1.p1 TRINITY_DN47027_c0_g1~~TRINITY_DN47027_c0_g1_i1.p1  ORF type:complete len:446 (+),score=5.40 TRINITY_DN47027_c0_g1_i1:100-1437(+)
MHSRGSDAYTDAPHPSHEVALTIANEMEEEPPHAQSSKSTEVNDWKGIRRMLCSTYVNLLLLCSPIALWATVMGWSSTSIFFLNFFPIIPLAYLLGLATEEVSIRTGEVVGGLLNATFGNAVEVILAVVGLQKNMVELVQASLLGSVLSNMLFVLGLSFFLGGLKHKQQTFNTSAVSANSGLLLLSALSLSLPTTYASLVPHTRNELAMSHGAAVGLAVVYIQFLWFQLKSHTHLFKDVDDSTEQVQLHAGTALGVMAAITLIVSLHSELLVGAIEGTVHSTGMNERFIGVILLPIVGNAAEHITAVTVAMKNRMTLSVGIAMGSSTQIAVFVVPVTVLVGWLMGVSMDLNFDIFEVVVMVMTVLIVVELVRDGTSTWLEGSMLLVAYFLVGVGCWHFPLPDSATAPTKVVTSATTTAAPPLAALAPRVSTPPRAASVSRSRSKR